MDIDEADPQARERVPWLPVLAAKHRRYNLRGLVSLLLASAGLATASSGVILLFFAPPNHVANATDWRLLGLGKEAWASVHVNLVILSVLTAVVHVVLHRSAIAGCLKGKAASD